MSTAETGKNRAPLVFVILLILQLLSMSWNARTRDNNQRILRSGFLTIAYPIYKSLGSIGSVLSNSWYSYVDLRGAHQENLQLHAENEQMRQELFKLKEELGATNRAAEMLKVQQVLPYKSVPARVIARSGSDFFKQVIIDKGSSAGVKLQQPVITPGGIVGRIIGVGPWAAQVQLVTDSYAGVSGQLSESRAYGEIKGLGKAACEMVNVSGLEVVKEGEPIVTTGLDGIYPKGLLIGYVESVSLGSAAKNHNISMRPAAGLDRLDEVLVLQPTEQDLRIDEKVK